MEVPDAHTDFWKKHHADGTCSFQSLVEDKCCYEYDDFCATYYKYEKGMLRADGTPIEGLYVCGNDQGGFYPHNYPSNFTGINAGRTATFARIAAKHALGVA